MNNHASQTRHNQKEQPTNLTTAIALRDLALELERAQPSAALEEILRNWADACKTLTRVLRIASSADSLSAQVSPDSALPPATSAVSLPGGVYLPASMSLDAAERFIIEQTLKRLEGNKTQTARLLGVTARTISNRLDVYSASSPTQFVDLRAETADQGIEPERVRMKVREDRPSSPF